MAPTTKPCAATRMWIRWIDNLVSPRLLIFISLYPTMAKNPAIPIGSRVSVKSKKGGFHFVLKCNGIMRGSSKTRMHQVYIDSSQMVGGGDGGINVGTSTYLLEQMDFPLPSERILTCSPPCQTSLLNLNRKSQYWVVTNFIKRIMIAY